MKSYSNYIKEKNEFTPGPNAKLGPAATKARDKVEIIRQKKHLDNQTQEYRKMSKDEGGGTVAAAHADMFANTKKAIHNEGVVQEDGMAGGVTVAAIAGSGDSRLPASQREPGVSKKRNPIIGKLARRALPKV